MKLFKVKYNLEFEAVVVTNNVEETKLVHKLPLDDNEFINQIRQCVDDKNNCEITEMTPKNYLEIMPEKWDENCIPFGYGSDMRIREIIENIRDFKSNKQKELVEKIKKLQEELEHINSIDD